MGDDKRPCAGGCGYAATWHPTHCCNACKRGGKTGHGCTHGPRCQKIRAGTTATRGDAAQKVAMDFSDKHGLQTDEFLNIEERVKLVSSLGHWSRPAAPKQQMVHLQQE